MSGTVGTNPGRGSGSVGSAGSGITTSASDPAVDTNPSGGVGTVFTNTTSGETYVCTDATTDDNTWTNVGDGTGDIKSIIWYGGRGLCVGGAYGGTSNTIQYITIASLGDSTDYGNLGTAAHSMGSASDGSRGVYGGGYSTDRIEYSTIASTGNATDFSAVLPNGSRYLLTATSNDTRAIWMGGAYPPNDSCDYVVIQTTGTATDFGNLAASKYGVGSASNGTRAIGFGGATPAVDTIQFFVFATPGNSSNFGDLSYSGSGVEAVEDTTRAVVADTNTADSDNLEYITMATESNTTAFGGLHISQYESGGVTNATRGVWMGGQSASVPDTSQYITIASTGDAADFGDLTIQVNDYNSGCSGE